MDGRLVYGVYRHFQQYFSYIVVVSLIGGGNWRNPQICGESLTNLITGNRKEHKQTTPELNITTIG